MKIRSHMRAEGTTRWRRAPILMVPAFLLVGALMFGIAAGAFPVNFAISGIPFKLNASQITADHFVQYAQPDYTTNGGSPGMIQDMENKLPLDGDVMPGVAGVDIGKGAYVADSITAMRNVQIHDMYQTVCAGLPDPFGFLGHLQVTIKAGNHGTPVTADNMLANSPAMIAGQATFWNIQVGADAKQALQAWGYWDKFGGDPPFNGNLGVGAVTGNFAQAATNVRIDDVHQVGTATAADRFTLPDLQMSARFVGSCP